jgi:transcriptional regulator with XRE-family HTH domain
MVNGYHNFLRNIRTKRGLTQQEVADYLDMSRPTYQALEAGKRDIGIAEMERLCSLLGVSMEDVFKTIDTQDRVVVSEASLSYEARGSSEERINIPFENAHKFREVLLTILKEIGAYPHVGQMVLYKILYFIDFDYYETAETALIGAEYIKNKRGPTPRSFASFVTEMEENREIHTYTTHFRGYRQKRYAPLRHPDHSMLSGQELDHVYFEIDRLKDMNGTQLSEYSHRDAPWQLTENFETIDYEFVFFRGPEMSQRTYSKKE